MRGTGAGFPEKWSRHQTCQNSGSIWTTLLDTWSGFLSGPFWTLELDSMILMGAFQLMIFYSMIAHHPPNDAQTFPKQWQPALAASSSQLPHFYCSASHHMVWYVPLVSLCQLSWFCPLQASCAPPASLLVKLKGALLSVCTAQLKHPSVINNFSLKSETQKHTSYYEEN